MRNNMENTAKEADTPVPAATLELLGSGESLSAAFVVVTPAIKAGLQELQLGQVLLVRVDNPSARVDVPAWCVLTGNVLQATAEEEGGVLCFFIRKERKRRTVMALVV